MGEAAQQCDVLIIGAGPGGGSAGLHTSRAIRHRDTISILRANRRTQCRCRENEGGRVGGE